MQGDPKTVSLASITGLELKQLLSALVTTANVGFRFRQIGEMWMSRHMKVEAVTDKTVMLHDQKDNRFYMVRINNIIQFDLDEKCQTFQPNFHYTVWPSAELDCKQGVI